MRQDVDSLKASNYNTGGMSFSAALEYLRKGYKIQRSGWNGKGMYLQLKQSYPVDKYLNETSPDEPFKPKDDMVAGQMLDHIVMKIAGDSKYWGEGYSDFFPWLASQTDILARDWHVLEEKEPELLHQIRLDINLRHFYDTFQEFKYYFNQVHNSNEDFAFENIKNKMYPLIYGVEKSTGSILKYLGLGKFETFIEQFVDSKIVEGYYTHFYATDVFSIVYQIAKDFEDLGIFQKTNSGIVLEKVDLYDNGTCQLLFHWFD